MLSSQTPSLYGLEAILTPTQSLHDGTSELEQINGYWGITNSQCWVVGPLYDWILEPFGEIYIAGIEDYITINSLRHGMLHTLAKGCHITQPDNEGCRIEQPSGEESYIKYSDLLHNFAK